ncbi:MAG: hypothetical protein AB7G13_08885 [Lautropia sp.]
MTIEFRKLVWAGLAAGCIMAALPAAAQSTLKVYSARMPDGSLMLSDRPPAGAKGGYQTSTYAVPEAKQRAAIEADREYWRRQGDAFDRRQSQRDAVGSRSGRQWSSYDAVAPDGPHHYGGYGYAARPIVSLRHVPRVYESSPGVVRGRDSGFIGSGFSTAR